MARRKPVATAQVPATHHLSTPQLDDLVVQANVPLGKRPACIKEIRGAFDWYSARLAGNARSNEARKAESLRRVVHTARELTKELRALPADLRLAVEPDYAASLTLGFARYIVKANIRAAEYMSFAKSNPEDYAAQELAKQTVSLPQSAQESVGDLLYRARAPLPLEVVLAALIETAEKARAAMENRVDRTWSKRRGTLARNELALQLKAIVRRFSNNERAAEDWVAVVFETAKISYPKRELKPADFAKMFILAIR